MEEYNFNDFVNKILIEIDKQKKELSKFNVMILGKSGVGKSTLINNLFSERVADTGIGKPVTKHIKGLSSSKDSPLVIYDTPGIEIAGDNDYEGILDEVYDVIENGIKTNDINNMIHCILYCVATTSHRIEDFECEFIKRIKEKYNQIPIILVQTLSYQKEETNKLMREIEKQNLPVEKIVPILSENFVIDEEYTAKAKGLDVLSKIIYKVIPEAVNKAFVVVQCANIDLKISKANATVMTAAGAAALTGATPIPFSDAALLVPAQVAMLGSITVIFGLPMEKSTMIAVVSSTIGTAGATVLGKTIVSNLLKCIPGAGSIAGGAISGVTAAALTAALGEAYIQLLVMVCKGEVQLSDIGTEKGKKIMKDLFAKFLKVKRNDKGEEI